MLFCLPVLIEPVVNLGLDIKRIAEVGGTGRGNPVHGAVSGQKVVSQLLVLSLVVLLHDAEVTDGLAYSKTQQYSKLDFPFNCSMSCGLSKQDPINLNASNHSIQVAFLIDMFWRL